MRQNSHLQSRGIIPVIFSLFILHPAALQASVILLETFETDGEGTRYTSTGGFTDGSDDYFTRTDGFTEASGIPAYTGFGGAFFWAAEDIDATENTAGVALLDFSTIAPSEFPAIQVSIDIGAGSNSAFDSLDDFVLVQYRFDAGPWATALAFQNNGQTYNGPLLADTDFDGIGDGVELGLSMQTITSSFIPVSGSILDLRIDTFMTSGSEAVAFDNIQVTAVPEPATTALFFSILSALMLLKKRFLPRREDESRA